MQRRAILLAALLAACTEVPPAMVYVPPDMRLTAAPLPITPDQAHFRSLSLKVPKVTGVGASNGDALSGALLGPAFAGYSKIWAETFRQALIEALQARAMFRAVLQDGPADLVLQADILSQAPTFGGAQVVVRYVMTQGEDGPLTWSATIAAMSGPDSAAAALLATGQSEYRATMRACGRNIALLTERIGRIDGI